MYKSYEIDYHGRSYFLGNSKTLQDAKKKERKALKVSKGEFPTFTEDGEKCVSHNGNNL